MEFDEIVEDVMGQLNLSSTEAEERVGKLVNRYYKRVTSSLGIATVARRVFDVEGLTTLASAEVAFELMEKVTRVWYLSDGVKQFLDEKTLDELRDEDPPSGDTPSRYAVVSRSATTVTILLDELAETEYSLFADGYQPADVLADDDEPAFPESFHDILVYGPLKDEARHLNQTELARDAKTEYEDRLSGLRMEVAKSAYLRIRQGDRPRGVKFKKDNQV